MEYNNSVVMKSSKPMEDFPWRCIDHFSMNNQELITLKRDLPNYSSLKQQVKDLTERKRTDKNHLYTSWALDQMNALLRALPFLVNEVTILQSKCIHYGLSSQVVRQAINEQKEQSFNDDDF